MLFLILNLEICVHQMQMPSFGMPSMPGFGQLQMPSLTTMQSSQTRSTQQAQQAQQTQQAQQAQLAQAQQAQAQQAKISATTSTSSELAEQEFFVPLRHIAKVKPEPISNQWRYLEESGQWLENVDRTHLVLASCRLVLHKHIRDVVIPNV